MNKDDMSDDAEFEAFLKGEGDLARRLQGMAQPEPGAALDAAILANARAAMAQDARPEAANDSGDAMPVPRRPASMGWRWRVPAGIAASVLVGVFAQRSFETSGDLNDLTAPQAIQAEQAAVPAAAPLPAPSAPPVADAVQNKAAAEENVVVQSVPPPAPAPAPAPAMRARSTRAPEVTVDLERAQPAPSVAAPPPAPAPVAAAPAAPAPAPVVEREVADLKAVSEARSAAALQKSKAETLKYSEDSAAGYSNYNRSMPAPVKIPESVRPAEPASRPVFGGAQSQLEPQSQTRVSANDSRDSGLIGGLVADKLVVSREAPAWLDRIEKMLEEGRHADAIKEWKAFRLAHPDYPVTDATRAKLEMRTRR